MKNPSAWIILAFALAACGGPTLGNPCQSSADCETGQSCYASYGKLLCSKGCGLAGSTLDCPGGTVCAVHESNQLLCGASCKADADCRSGFTCQPAGTAGKLACTPTP